MIEWMSFYWGYIVTICEVLFFLALHVRYVLLNKRDRKRKVTRLLWILTIMFTILISIYIYRSITIPAWRFDRTTGYYGMIAGWLFVAIIFNIIGMGRGKVLLIFPQVSIILSISFMIANFLFAEARGPKHLIKKYNPDSWPKLYGTYGHCFGKHLYPRSYYCNHIWQRSSRKGVIMGNKNPEHPISNWYKKYWGVESEGIGKPIGKVVGGAQGLTIKHGMPNADILYLYTSAPIKCWGHKDMAIWSLFAMHFILFPLIILVLYREYEDEKKEKK